MIGFLYLGFAIACFAVGYCHNVDHKRHHVPGLLFVAITMALEGVEYSWIAMVIFGYSDWQESPIMLKNVITTTRIVLCFGFWLGVRYGTVKLANVRGVIDAVRLAVEGYAGGIKQIVWYKFRSLKQGLKRLRRFHRKP